MNHSLTFVGCFYFMELTFVFSFYFNDLTLQLLNLTSHRGLDILKVFINLVNIGKEFIL